MFQLIRKDLLTQKKIAFFLGIVFLPSALLGSVRVFDVGQWGYAIAILFYSFWLAVFANFNKPEDERHQGVMINSLPVSRKEIVSAKYVSAIVWWSISVMLVVVVVLILSGFTSLSLKDLSWEGIVLSFIGLYLFLAIFYPLYFAIGYRLAAVISLLLMFFILQGWVLELGQWITGETELEMIPLVMGETTDLFKWIGLSAALTFVSYFASVLIYKKKDL